jgi:hypothetical protein
MGELNFSSSTSSCLRVLYVILVSGTVALSFPLTTTTRRRSSTPAAVSSLRQNAALLRSYRSSKCILASSFYGKFDEEEDDDDDDDDEDDDDDDDDDYDDELDDAAVANFRNKMANLFGDDSSTDSPENVVSSVDELINFARGKQDASGSGVDSETEWARATEQIAAGVVLVANPAKFCTDFGDQPAMPSPTLLAKFGLTLPPPADLGPDRRADLLPVLVLVNTDRGARAVLLNRRTGYLLGDLEQQPGDTNNNAKILQKFCIRESPIRCRRPITD